MWGFGLYLMRLADYLAGRSHQKGDRPLEDTLDDHIKEKHSDML